MRSFKSRYCHSGAVSALRADTKEISVYPSISYAARLLNLRQSSISIYLKGKQLKPFKGKYYFKLIKE
ncbi:hypothetical protein HGI15_21845 [Modestobacter lapidis]|nr:hypothetical protein [Modestobacter lapidis]